MEFSFDGTASSLRFDMRGSQGCGTSNKAVDNDLLMGVGNGEGEIALFDSPDIGALDASLAVPAGTSGEAMSMLCQILEADPLRSACSGFFFRVVHKQPSNMKATGSNPNERPHNTEMTITLHPIRGFDPGARHVIVALDPSSAAEGAEATCLWQPPLGLPPGEWHRLAVVWSRVGDVAFSLPSQLKGVNADTVRHVCGQLIAAEAFPPVTDIRVTVPFFVLHAHMDAAPRLRECLDAMLAAQDLVSLLSDYVDRSTWRLTPKGFSLLRCVQPLGKPRFLYQCHRTDSKYEEYTLFELWDRMRSCGWSFAFVTRRVARGLRAYAAGGEKLMNAPMAKVLPRFCMIAHFRCSEGTLHGPIAPARPGASISICCTLSCGGGGVSMLPPMWAPVPCWLRAPSKGPLVVLGTRERRGARM